MVDYISQFPKIFLIKQAAIFLQLVYKFLPKAKVLGNLIKKDSKIDFFVADLLVANNTTSSPQLYSFYQGTYYQNPNINDVWPACEGRGLNKFFLELGQFNKTENISVKKMSDAVTWDSDIVLFGAQTGRCRDFFRLMENVGYRIEDDGIYSNSDGNKIISLPTQAGYGLVVKASNPMGLDKETSGFLLGGYGVLGTEASIEYFFNNLNELGRTFGEKDFSLIVKKEIGDPEGRVKRLEEYDISY